MSPILLALFWLVGVVIIGVVPALLERRLGLPSWAAISMVLIGGAAWGWFIAYLSFHSS